MKRFIPVFVLAALLTPATQTKATPPPNCNRHVKTALAVGWKKRDIPRLLVICNRESKGYEKAHNKRDPHGGSYGLMQINGSNKTFLKNVGVVRKSMNELWKPANNFKAALALFERHQWLPWNVNSSAK